MAQVECTGSYARADKAADNVVVERSGGRWAVGTCPTCGKRVSVMRPTKAQPWLLFGRHKRSTRNAA